jgi:hypothetical protein
MPSQIDITVSEDEEEKKGMTHKEAMIVALGSKLDQKFHQYSGARQNKEDEWVRAIRQNEGLWDADDRSKIEQAFGYEGDSVPPPVNITRPKTNIAISRMQDSQFPVGGDFNFQMSPTPVPQIINTALSVTDPDPGMQAEAVAQGLNPEDAPTPQEVAQDVIDDAMERARIMSMEIRDDLIETGYGTKARLAMEDLAILGSAVIKGPVLTPHVRRTYQPELTSDGVTIQTMHSVVEHKPDVFRVDPRLFYPDPSARTPDEIEDSFELHLMSRSDLLKLADSPAFMPKQVSKAAMIGTDGSVLPNSITDTAYLNSGVITKNRYVVKEYHGPIDKQALLDGEVISQEDFDDELSEFYGEVWICNGLVLRISLSYLEGTTSTPYHVAVWERDPGYVFGHGVPYLVRHPQRVVNNAYMLLLDNASLTSGPQIVLNKEMIEPASKDGNYDISPLKVWFLTEYGADVREAMQFVNVPAQMEGIGQIIDMAMQFSDLESSTPLMQQGDMPTGNNTLTGVAKVMSATNINQKRASIHWDDYVTKPLITGIYHHNMQYGDNEDAKGDLEVHIGGATERIDSELRAQELERILGLAQSDPEFQMQINPSRAFRQLAALTRAGDILRSPQEIEEEKARLAEQEQQPDPESIKAQAAMITAQARQMQAQNEAQTAQADMELKKASLQIELEQAREEALSRREQAFADIQVSQDKKDIEMMKLAVAQQTTASKLATQQGIAQVTNETERQALAVDLTKFREESALKREFGEGI